MLTKMKIFCIDNQSRIKLGVNLKITYKLQELTQLSKTSLYQRIGGIQRNVATLYLYNNNEG